MMPKSSPSLREHHVELVCLAGYMRLLSPGFIRRLSAAHPEHPSSLLPAFPAWMRSSRPSTMA